MFRSFTMLLSLSVNLSGRSVWKRATLRGDLLTFHRIIIALRNCRIGMQDEIRIERIPLRVIALNYFVMSVIVLFVLFVTATSALDCLLIKLKMIKFCCEKSHILFTRKLSTKNLSTLFSCFPSSRIPSKLFERVAFRFPSPQRSGTEFFRTEG